MKPGPNADRYPARWETPESVLDREKPVVPRTDIDRPAVDVPLLPPPSPERPG
jgi:hypothetical protein